MRLADNVVHFAGVLRRAGLSVGTDRVLDALKVLPETVESRRDWHATLATLFVTRHEQQVLFDEAFDAFWRDPELEERMRALLLPQVRGKTPALDRANPRVAEAFRLGRDRPAFPQEAPDEVAVDAALTFDAHERLRKLDFEKMTLDEWRVARALMARLVLPVPEIRMRRQEASRSGQAIDLRATMRRMARQGGELSSLARRRPQLRPAPIVALCDISGSMHRYTRAFLHFLHALTRSHGHVSTLLFGTRLTNVTRQLRHRDVDQAVDAVSEAVPDWAGGTRIAACLREFNFRWSRRLLAQNACVLLVTDGLERDEAGLLAEEMARLHRSAHRLLWLNPLLRYEGFVPRASGILAMRPHVDAFLPVHNVESLAGLAAALNNSTPTPFIHAPH